MTNNYNAGNIEVSTSVDLKGIRDDLKALQTEIAKSGEKSGEQFVFGFESAKVGKRLQDGMVSGFEAAATAAASDAGEQSGKGFAAGFKAQLGGLKKGVGSTLGQIAGGALKGLAAGGALALLNVGIGLAVAGVGKLVDGFKNGFTKAARAASSAAKLVHEEQSRVNEVFKETDSFLEKYSQKSDIAAENLDKFRKAGESLGEIGEIGVNFAAGRVESYLEELDQAKAGQDGLEASIKKYAAAQKLAFAVEATENYARVLGEIEEQEKRLADLQNKPTKYKEEIELVSSRIRDLKGDLDSIREKRAEILAQPDSAFTKEIQKSVDALKNQNALAIAKASLDHDEVKRLEEKALIASKTEEFLRAYPAHLANTARAQEDATKAAEDYVKALADARVEGEKRRRAEEYRLAVSKRQTSELRDQLAIEQAKGEGADQTIIKALETQLLLEQKIAEFKDAKYADYEKRAEIYVASIERAKDAANKVVQDRNGTLLKADLELELAQTGGFYEWQKFLERQQKEADLTARFEAAGHDAARANELAQQHLYNLELLMAQRQEKEMLAALAKRDLHLALEKARHDKDFDEVARLEKEIELQSKIQELRELGLTDYDALKRAERELILYDLEKEIEARVRKNDEQIKELEAELALAKARGESTVIEDLERQIAFLKERRPYLEDGLSEDEATQRAKSDVNELTDAENIGKVRDLFKGGIKAAIDGDFEDFLADKLQGAADSMFDNAINTLLDSLLKEGGPLDRLILNTMLTIADQKRLMLKLKQIRHSWPIWAIFAFYVYLAFHALSGSQGLMSWADYKADIDRLTHELEAAKTYKSNLKTRISGLRVEKLNADILDSLAREKVFLSDPNEMTIWLDP